MDDKELFDKLNDLCKTIKECYTGELSFIISATNGERFLGCLQGESQDIFGMIAHMILRTTEYLETRPQYVIKYVLENILYMQNIEEGGENELDE